MLQKVNDPVACCFLNPAASLKPVKPPPVVHSSASAQLQAPEQQAEPCLESKRQCSMARCNSFCAQEEAAMLSRSMMATNAPTSPTREGQSLTPDATAECQGECVCLNNIETWHLLKYYRGNTRLASSLVTFRPLNQPMPITRDI